MLFNNGDGTYLGGVYDVICILKDVNTERFHAAFFEEAPMPGTIQTHPSIIRLKSKMHHTRGADTLVEAMVHFKELKETISVSDDNIWENPIDWDGETGIVWTFANWKKEEVVR